VIRENLSAPSCEQEMRGIEELAMEPCQTFEKAAERFVRRISSQLSSFLDALGAL
jgi:hypothetical protein